MTRKELIEERLASFETEGKDPNTTETRKWVLRKFYKLWKYKLEHLDELSQSEPNSST